MKIDWLLVIGMTLMINSISIMIMLNVVGKNQDECLKNPLMYAASYYTNDTGYEMVGSASFLMHGHLISPIIYFDSRGVYHDERPIDITSTNFSINNSFH